MLPIETDCCDFELRILEFVSAVLCVLCVSAVWLVLAEWNRRDAENAETQRTQRTAETLSLNKMKSLKSIILILFIAAAGNSQTLSRDQWGAMPVTVSHEGSKWLVKGKNNSFSLNENDFSLSIEAGPARWQLMPSKPGDMIVRSKSEELTLRIADAKKILIVPYDTGFKTGVKIFLSAWSNVDLDLFLTICLEGKSEELVFEPRQRKRRHAAPTQLAGCP